MQAEKSVAAVIEEASERIAHGSECDFGPRDVLFGHQGDFERFIARFEIQIEQSRSVDDVDLADVGNIHESKHRSQFYAGSSFLECLANGRLTTGFIVLHEARGERPEAMTWLDCTTAHQDLVLPLDQSPCDNFGIRIVDRAALITHMPGQPVPIGNPVADSCTALGTVFHDGAMG